MYILQFSLRFRLSWEHKECYVSACSLDVSNPELRMTGQENLAVSAIFAEQRGENVFSWSDNERHFLFTSHSHLMAILDTETLLLSRLY